MNLALKKALIATAAACFAMTIPAFAEEGQESHQVIAITNDAGIVTREDWMLEKKYHPNGTHHRIGAPAFIRRDDVTGVIVLEHWIRNGKFDREGGPAITVRDRLTGAVTYEEWWEQGVQIQPPQQKFAP